ncbi:valine--tRNA ligase [Buchnera aphidicola (Periphyllus koelreuteriae)]|uniref:valine--tRNA ligase n=1 Tax=Buchnera aphidicola TaxID=9 RepID=UPI0031B81852
MKKNYNPKLIEEKLYKFWEKKKFFKVSKKKSNKKSFCIIMPPPNVTGILHMGHAFQQTIMDILIRFNRMKGKNTLFQVGTDHAGIATQLLIEKKILKKNGKTRKDYKKKYFIKKTWNWVNKCKKKIFYQMKRLGNSIDWSREKFTLDPKISKGVKKSFIILYNKGLIYKKKTIVNWDIHLQTVISDLEVNNKNVKTTMWYIKYFFSSKKNILNKKNYIIVATTRPETIFGDVAIAINPKDKRYIKCFGWHVIVPIINRIIPIIFDYEIKIKKGTGCVKITPAHDFFDYKIGIKHSLSMIKIFSKNGNIKKKISIYDHKGKKQNIDNIEIPKKFHMLNRFDSRKKIIKFLKKYNFLKKKEYINSFVPFGDRSNTIIEPMLTNQWFLKTSSLSKRAILEVKNKNIVFFPKKYQNMYLSWMNNIQDWCISRQLWWGHKIPVWYDKNNKIYVGKSKNKIRKKYNLNKNFYLKRDKNVLDTWFSSSLWTFLTLGWPKKSKELKMFHPTNIIISGFDIIFFWISRMIMLTIRILKKKNGIHQIPFKKIYITGLIRDEKGQKMSKSKGNILNPIDLIDGINLKQLIYNKTYKLEKNSNKFSKILKNIYKNFPNGIESFGADSVRFTCAALSNNSRNIFWDMNRLKGYRNFCNKLWNASRFIFKYITEYEIIKKISINKLSFFDKWIITKLNILIKKYVIYIKKYRFDIISNLIHDFIWNNFCDWYLEISKSIFKTGKICEINNSKKILIYILEILLKLSHPIIPFITEYIWKKIQCLKKNNIIESIVKQKFPKYNKNNINLQSIKKMKIFKNIFIELRSVRNFLKIKYNKKISIFLKNFNKNTIFFIKKNKIFIKNIMFLKKIKIFSKKYNSILKISIIRNIGSFEILIPIKGIINKKYEFIKLLKKIKACKIKINILKKITSNIKFLKNAPNNVVKKEINKLRNLKQKLNNLTDYKKLIEIL